MTMTTTNDAELHELRRENEVLRAQLEGDFPRATFWLQRKVWSQKLALDALNRRVVTQRFVLRTLEALGRGLTREEYVAARDASREELRDRIDEPEA